MKAFLINPHDHTIEEVDYSGDYKQIYELIGAEIFDVARINEHGDGIYVDDNGLFTHSDLFQTAGYPHPLAGRGLVLGCDYETGDSTTPHVDFHWLRDNTKFFVNLLGNLVRVA